VSAPEGYDIINVRIMAIGLCDMCSGGVAEWAGLVLRVTYTPGGQPNSPICGHLKLLHLTCSSCRRRCVGALRRDVTLLPFSKEQQELNVLKPHLRITLQTLLQNGASQREIERVTGVDRKTIRRYAAEAKSPGVAPALKRISFKIPHPGHRRWQARPAKHTAGGSRRRCSLVATRRAFIRT
jgi:hypothetical protein